MAKGAGRVTHKAVTDGSAVKHSCKGYNALLIHHEMTGTTAGGYVSLAMGNEENGVYIAHHGKGNNIKSAALATNYTCIYEGIMDWVQVTLNRTDGTHTVTVQPINI